MIANVPLGISQLQLGTDLPHYCLLCTVQAARRKWPIQRSSLLWRSSASRRVQAVGSGVMSTVGSTTVSTWPHGARTVLCYKLHCGGVLAVRYSDKKQSSHPRLPSASSNHTNHSIRHIYRTYTTHDQTTQSLGLYTITVSYTHLTLPTKVNV